MANIAEIIGHSDSGPHHRIARLKHAGLAKRALPGHQLQVGDLCLPILRSSSTQAWVELLYLQAKAREFAQQEVGTRLEFHALVNQAIKPSSISKPALLIADEHGLAAILFLSLSLASQGRPPALVLLGSHDHFPFRPQPSRLILPQLPAHAIATVPLLEDRRIACRLAHSQDRPGCYDGTVSALVQLYLENRSEEEELTILASGTMALAQEIQTLARAFSLPYQFLATSP